MNIKLLTIVFLLFAGPLLAQQPKIEWLKFEDVATKMNTKPKKILVDVYTDWCSWCKKMDNTTFTDPIIADYMNKFFYSVKLNAEGKDPIIFKGKTFVNPSPDDARSVHQFAKAILQGKLSYPSYVLMDENYTIITVIPGYSTAEKFEPLLHYFVTESYKTTDWNEYNTSFKGSFKPKE